MEYETLHTPEDTLEDMDTLSISAQAGDQEDEVVPMVCSLSVSSSSSLSSSSEPRLGDPEVELTPPEDLGNPSGRPWRSRSPGTHADYLAIEASCPCDSHSRRVRGLFRR